MYCTNCGSALPSDGEFCIECGTRDEGAVAGATVPAKLRVGKAKWLALAAVAVVAALGAGVYLYANLVAKQKVDEVIAGFDGKIGVTYGSVRANPFTRGVTVKDIKVTTLKGKPIEGIRIDGITVSGILGTSGAARALDLEVERLTFDVAQMNPNVQKLAGMGYERLEFDAHLDYRYSPEAREFHLNRLQIVGQDLVAIEASLHVGDLPDESELTERGPSPSTTIRGGELMIKDAVFIERLVNSLAEKDGVDPAAYKKRLTDTVTAMLGGGSSKLDKDLPAAIVGLINEPRSTLRFTIAPKDPVTVAQIKSATEPASLVNLLNLEVGR